MPRWLIVLFGIALGWTASTVYFVLHRDREYQALAAEHVEVKKRLAHAEIGEARAEASALAQAVTVDRLRRELMKHNIPWMPLAFDNEGERIPKQNVPTTPGDKP